MQKTNRNRNRRTDGSPAGKMPKQKRENVSSNPSPANSGASTRERNKTRTDEHTEDVIYSESTGELTVESVRSSVTAGAAAGGIITTIVACATGSGVAAALGTATATAAGIMYYYENKEKFSDFNSIGSCFNINDYSELAVGVAVAGGVTAIGSCISGSVPMAVIGTVVAGAAGTFILKKGGV